MIPDPPYDFSQAKFQNPLLKGYRITFHLLFDGDRILYFRSFDEAVRVNRSLRDDGFVTEYKQVTFLIRDDRFPTIVEEIENYVSLTGLN